MNVAIIWRLVSYSTEQHFGMVFQPNLDSSIHAKDNLLLATGFCGLLICNHCHDEYRAYKQCAASFQLFVVPVVNVMKPVVFVYRVLQTRTRAWRVSRNVCPAQLGLFPPPVQYPRDNVSSDITHCSVLYSACTVLFGGKINVN